MSRRAADLLIDMGIELMPAELPSGMTALGIPGTTTIYYSGKGEAADQSLVAAQVARVATARGFDPELTDAFDLVALELLARGLR